jgi:hypothetical protein
VAHLDAFAAGSSLEGGQPRRGRAGEYERHAFDPGECGYQALVVLVRPQGRGVEHEWARRRRFRRARALETLVVDAGVNRDHALRGYSEALDDLAARVLGNRDYAGCYVCRPLVGKPPEGSLGTAEQRRQLAVEQLPGHALG